MPAKEKEADMNKAKVDDMLNEMIGPKIKEIEEKFSSGGSLTQDDINTLLLKSQYNHINHLDAKLNEVTQSVVQLEYKFQKLENKFYTLEQKFVTLEQKFVTLEQKFETLEQKIEASIQRALNKNMILLITVMGVFLTLSKLIDKF